jgi:diguanylate cyclase (GGDEF)-like protein
MLGERLRKAVCSQPITIEGVSVEVTISLGVATTLDPDRQDMQGLLAAADNALYRAKSEGRNRLTSATHPFPAVDPSEGPVSG